MNELRRKCCFFETWRPEWGSTRDLRLSKQAALTTAPGPPPIGIINLHHIQSQALFPILK